MAMPIAQPRCSRTLDHMAGSQRRPKSSLLSIPDYFGPMETPKDSNSAEECDAQGDARISDTEFGFYVLGRLNDEQRGQLARTTSGIRYLAVRVTAEFEYAIVKREPSLVTISLRGFANVPKTWLAMSTV